MSCSEACSHSIDFVQQMAKARSDRLHKIYQTRLLFTQCEKCIQIEKILSTAFSELRRSERASRVEGWRPQAVYGISKQRKAWGLVIAMSRFTELNDITLLLATKVFSILKVPWSTRTQQSTFFFTLKPRGSFYQER